MSRRQSHCSQALNVASEHLPVLRCPAFLRPILIPPICPCLSLSLLLSLQHTHRYAGRNAATGGYFVQHAHRAEEIAVPEVPATPATTTTTPAMTATRASSANAQLPKCPHGNGGDKRQATCGQLLQRVARVCRTRQHARGSKQATIKEHATHVYIVMTTARTAVAF